MQDANQLAVIHSLLSSSIVVEMLLILLFMLADWIAKVGHCTRVQMDFLAIFFAIVPHHFLKDLKR